MGIRVFDTSSVGTHTGPTPHKVGAGLKNNKHDPYGPMKKMKMDPHSIYQEFASSLYISLTHFLNTFF